MLTYEENPTTIVHEGQSYTLFADDHDASRWYVIPTTPRVCQQGDQLELRLIKYRGKPESSAVGGWLTMSVDLGLDDALRAALSARITKEKNLKQPVTLSAPFWVGGKAQLILPGAPLDAFAVSLTPDARAVLTWSGMTMDEVSTVESFLSSAAADNNKIYVAYDLDFVAVRQPFSMTIKADSREVRSYVSQTFQAGAIFAQLEVEDAIDKMCSDGTVTIEVVDRDPDEQSRRFAVQELTSMLLATFFEPVMLTSPQAGAPPVFGWRLVTTTIDEEISRTLDFNLSTRQHIVRKVYPQGALAGLPTSSEDLKPYIDPIDITPDFFDNRQLRTYCAARFDDASRLDQIIAEFRYGAAQKTQVFKSKDQDTLQLASWPVSIQSGEPIEEVEIKTSFEFSPTSEQNPWPRQTISETISSSHYVLDPSRFYRIVDVSISALRGLDWSMFQWVEVVLNSPLYTSKPLTISQNSPTAMLPVLWPNDLGNIPYALTYKSKSGKDSVEGTLTRGNPAIFYDEQQGIPQIKTLRIICAMDWTRVQEVDLEVSLRASNQMYSFTPDNPGPRDFRAVVSASEDAEFGYSGRIVLSDGTTSVIRPAKTSNGVLRLQLPLEGERAPV